MMKRAPAASILAAARLRNRDTIAVVGTTKHVGKTSMIASLIDAARAEHATIGVVSLGRDGEARDVFDEREKPRFILRAGMLAVVARTALSAGMSLAYCDSLDAPNALGELVIVRALTDVATEITGPPSGTALLEAIEALRRHGATALFVDGALDRMAPLAAVDPAFVLATGMAAHADVTRIADGVALLHERLSLSPPPPDHEVLAIDGVLDAERLREVLATDGLRDLLIEDPLRMTHEAYLIVRRLRRVWSRRKFVVVACCTNAYTPQRSCHPERLAQAVAEATGVATVDCVAGMIIDYV